MRLVPSSALFFLVWFTVVTTGLCGCEPVCLPFFWGAVGAAGAGGGVVGDGDGEGVEVVVDEGGKLTQSITTLSE